MKISESLFAVSIGKSDPKRVKQLSDRLFAAYEEAAERGPASLDDGMSWQKKDSSSDHTER